MTSALTHVSFRLLHTFWLSRRDPRKPNFGAAHLRTVLRLLETAVTFWHQILGRFGVAEGQLVDYQRLTHMEAKRKLRKRINPPTLGLFMIARLWSAEKKGFVHRNWGLPATTGNNNKLAAVLREDETLWQMQTSTCKHQAHPDPSRVVSLLYQVSNFRRETPEKYGTSERCRRSHRKRQRQMIVNSRHETDNSVNSAEMPQNGFFLPRSRIVVALRFNCTHETWKILLRNCSNFEKMSMNNKLFNCRNSSKCLISNCTNLQIYWKSPNFPVIFEIFHCLWFYFRQFNASTFSPLWFTHKALLEFQFFQQGVCLLFQARKILPQNFSDHQTEELQKKLMQLCNESFEEKKTREQVNNENNWTEKKRKNKKR